MLPFDSRRPLALCMARHRRRYRAMALRAINAVHRNTTATSDCTTASNSTATSNNTAASNSHHNNSSVENNAHSATTSSHNSANAHTITAAAGDQNAFCYIANHNAQHNNSIDEVLNNLRVWAIKNNISHNHLTDLLRILKSSHECFASIHIDARTLLKTDRNKANVLSMGRNGLYYHFGVKKQLSELLSSFGEKF